MHFSTCFNLRKQAAVWITVCTILNCGGAGLAISKSGVTVLELQSDTMIQSIALPAGSIVLMRDSLLSAVSLGHDTVIQSIPCTCSTETYFHPNGKIARATLSEPFSYQSLKLEK